MRFRTESLSVYSAITWHNDPMPLDDLNKLLIPNDEQHSAGQPLVDYSMKKGNISVFFRDLKERLIENIDKADAVVGCVAWLTDIEIVRALASKCSQIVVQKEDFLRPDGNMSNAALREAYSHLSFLDRESAGPLLGTMSYLAGDYLQVIDGVRCVGNHNSEKKPVHPRAHHKFVVFCRIEEVLRKRYLGADEALLPTLRPYAVWTGSFNFSFNAGRSLENAVLIEDETIAAAFQNEWEQLCAISEPLDWESTWVEPSWRIGS